MSYFREHYSDIKYPPFTATGGLYNAQLGAIHEIASHFTVHEQPALITMPTGSGKTAVLMMTPFVLSSTRVLVITPSRMVREQIVEDFSGLVTLRRAGVIPSAVRSPKVKELKKQVTSIADWEALREFEVVVSTPNCTSPTYSKIPSPPQDLFDLVLVDEAHHSSAKSWAELIAALPVSRKVLFTATPFRRDRGEIKARYAFSYPMERAFREGIFGKIKYVPVSLSADDPSSDKAIAIKTQEVFSADRANGLNHYVMVRTDSLKRANELHELYKNETSLRLEVIHSNVPGKRVKTILADLNASRLDGILCVNMLGEGFNFPRLKIAAIHSPHRSLEVTLQFIGRFARTNASDIGEAKFVAVLSEIELQGERLFDEGAVWQDMVENLSYGRIVEEVEVRERLDQFDRLQAQDPDFSDLSLYSLHPRSHVKVYDVHGVDVNLDSDIQIANNWQERYRNLTSDGNVMVLVYRQLSTPKWSASDNIVDAEHVLVVVFHDVDRELLFINSSLTAEGLYEAIAVAVAPAASTLSLAEVGRVVRRLKQQRVFNFGMRNIQATNAAESYRIIAGPDTQATIQPADARLYRQGHVFMTGEVEGERVTIGYSSGSKVWSSDAQRIPGLLKWCRALGQEIRLDTAIVTNSGLDYVPTGDVVATLPPNIVLAQWNRDAFDLASPAKVEYAGDDGRTYRCLLMDLEIQIARGTATNASVSLQVTGPQLQYDMVFSLDPAVGEFYEVPTGHDANRVQVVHGQQPVSLVEYVNIFYLDLYTADGGVLVGNELSVPLADADPIDRNQLETWDWSGVDIESETAVTATGMSVHDRVRAELARRTDGVVFIDHGSGEMADFVVALRAGDTITFTLYHCKGSSEGRPGARVEDVYEVCGQAQKSVVWRSLDRIRRRLTNRLQSLQYIRGTAQELETLLEQSRTLRQQFAVVIVQPGISVQRLSRPLMENLGATSAHVMRAGFQRLTIIASA